MLEISISPSLKLEYKYGHANKVSGMMPKLGPFVLKCLKLK